MNNYNKPLKIWKYFACLFLISQLAIFIFVKYNINHLKNTVGGGRTEIQNAVDKIKEINKNSFNVVVIGSSLTGYGLTCDDNMVKTTINGKPIKIIKVWNSGDHFGDMIKKEHLLDQLIVLKPDLICVQKEFLTIDFMLAPEYGKYSLFLFFKNMSTYNWYAINYLRYGNFSEVDTFRDGEQCPPIDRIVNLDTVNYIPKERIIKPLNKTKLSFNYFEKLKRLNIKTIVFDIPKPTFVENIFIKNGFNIKVLTRLSFFKERFGIDYWSYDGPTMYFSNYIDGGHLNQSGRKIYTKWFVDKIIREY